MKAMIESVKDFMCFAFDLWISGFLYLFLILTPIAIIYGLLQTAMWLLG